MEVEAARRHRKGSEILPPPARLPLPTPFFPQPLLNTSVSAKDSPFQTKPEVKRRRVYFTFASPPPPPLSSTPLPFLPFLPPPPTYPPRMLDRFNPPFDAVSTIVSVNMLSFSRYNSTFLSRRISIPHTLDRIAWMES